MNDSSRSQLPVSANAGSVANQLEQYQNNVRLWNFVEKYRSSKVYPLIVFLTQLSPWLDPRLTWLAAAHSAVEAYLDQRLERMERFFDSLDFEDLPIEGEILTPDFIHCGLLAFDEAVRSSSHEKAEKFARLFAAGLKTNLLKTLDMYFEYFDALRQLSMREMAVLEKLEFFETKFGSSENGTSSQHIGQYWDQFINGIVQDYGIPEEEAGAFMFRLTRTGCFETFAGQFLDHRFGEGRLTPMYYRLKKLIEGHSVSDK